jgi:capsular exopolysaccharide synthesis family protein
VSAPPEPAFARPEPVSAPPEPAFARPEPVSAPPDLAFAPPEPAPAQPARRAEATRDPVDDVGISHGRLDEKLILSGDLPPGAVEQYRKVAASLHQLQLDRGVKIVMIASAVAEEGKSITASNIALTLSESFKRRVLLVDADLRRPSIHAMFDTPNVTGLSDALQAERHEKLTIFEVTRHLSILPAGPPNRDPMGSLASERMRMIVAEAGAKFDWVIIDTPPVGVLADAKLLAEIVDTVVLVIGAGRTSFRAIERAVEAIDRKRIAGVVLNRVVEQPAGYHYYEYYGTASRRR